jgi:hypothetical protein
VIYTDKEMAENRKRAIAMAIVETSRWTTEDDITIQRHLVASQVNRQFPHLRCSERDVSDSAKYAAHYFEHDRLP